MIRINRKWFKQLVYMQYALNLFLWGQFPRENHARPAKPGTLHRKWCSSARSRLSCAPCLGHFRQEYSVFTICVCLSKTLFLLFSQSQTRERDKQNSPKSRAIICVSGCELTCTSTAEWDSASLSVSNTFDTGTIPGSWPHVVIINFS